MELFLRVRPFTTKEAHSMREKGGDPASRYLIWKPYFFDPGVWSSTAPSQRAYPADQQMAAIEILRKSQLVRRAMHGESFLVFTYGPPGTGKSYTLLGRALASEATAKYSSLSLAHSESASSSTISGSFFSSQEVHEEALRTATGPCGTPSAESSTRQEDTGMSDLKGIGDDRGVVPEFFQEFFHHGSQPQQPRSTGRIELSVMEYNGGEWVDLLTEEQRHITDASEAMFRPIDSTRAALALLSHAQRQRMEMGDSMISTGVGHLVLQVRVRFTDSGRAPCTSYFVDFAGDTGGAAVASPVDAEMIMHVSFVSVRNELSSGGYGGVLDSVDAAAPDDSRGTRWAAFLRRTARDQGTFVVGIFTIAPGATTSAEAEDSLRFSQRLRHTQNVFTGGSDAVALPIHDSLAPTENNRSLPLLSKYLSERDRAECALVPSAGAVSVRNPGALGLAISSLEDHNNHKVTDSSYRQSQNSVGRMPKSKKCGSLTSTRGASRVDGVSERYQCYVRLPSNRSLAAVRPRLPSRSPQYISHYAAPSQPRWRANGTGDTIASRLLGEAIQLYASEPRGALQAPAGAILHMRSTHNGSHALSGALQAAEWSSRCSLKRVEEESWGLIILRHQNLRHRTEKRDDSTGSTNHHSSYYSRGAKSPASSATSAGVYAGFSGSAAAVGERLPEIVSVRRCSGETVDALSTLVLRRDTRTSTSSVVTSGKSRSSKYSSAVPYPPMLKKLTVPSSPSRGTARSHASLSPLGRSRRNSCSSGRHDARGGLYTMVVVSNMMVTAQKDLMAEEMLTRSGIEHRELRLRRKYEAKFGAATSSSKKSFHWLPARTREFFDV